MNKAQKLINLIESLQLSTESHKYKILDDDNSRLKYRVNKTTMYIAFYYLIFQNRVSKQVLETITDIAISELQLNPVFISSCIKKIYNIDIFTDIQTTGDVHFFIDIVNKYHDISELEKYFNQCKSIPGFIKIQKILLENS